MKKRLALAVLVALTLNSVANGQVSYSGFPVGLPGVTPTLSAKAVQLNATGDIATLAVPAYVTKYSVSALNVTNCSGTPILAQMAVYTGAGATGTNVVAAATLTAATSGSAIVPMTVGGATTALTASILYIRITVANAASVTCDVYATLNNLS